MAILITGGAGFIGSHLVDFYMNRQEEVYVIDNLSTGKKENIAHHLGKKNFHWIEADLLKWPDLKDTLKKCTEVLHLAAVVGMFNVLEHPISTLKVNVEGTQRLLDYIAVLDNPPLMAITSTSEVYGSRHKEMKETDILHLEASDRAHSSYPVSKLCNEVAVMTYHKAQHLPMMVLRLFNTVGLRQSARYGMVLPRFVKQALSNQPFSIFGDGKQTRAFCDVSDTCKIIGQLLCTQEAIGQIVNVGNDQEITILGLAKKVKNLCHSNSNFEFINYANVYGPDYLNIQHRKPDLSKLKSLIPLKPFKSLEETIKEMIELSR